MGWRIKNEVITFISSEKEEMDLTPPSDPYTTALLATNYMAVTNFTKP